LEGRKVAKMASLHAEGLTDNDLKEIDIATTLQEILVD
jgi:hypothetical protein